MNTAVVTYSFRLFFAATCMSAQPDRLDNYTHFCAFDSRPASATNQLIQLQSHSALTRLEDTNIS